MTSIAYKHPIWDFMYAKRAYINKLCVTLKTMISKHIEYIVNFIWILILLVSCQTRSDSATSSKNNTDVLYKNSETGISQNLDYQIIKNSLKLDGIRLLGSISDSENVIYLLEGEKSYPTYKEQGLYIYSTSPIPFQDSIKSMRFSLPGNTYDILDSLVYSARVFYGDCTEKYPFSIIWIQNEKQENNSWLKSIFIVTPLNSKRLTYSITEDNDLEKEILASLNNGRCEEIAGTNTYLEP